MNNPYVLPFNHPEATNIALSGGKGKNLALLATSGFQVPAGFIITTTAFQKFLEQPQLYDHLQKLFDQITAYDVKTIKEISAEIRQLITKAQKPIDFESQIKTLLSSSNPQQAYAVRSSATAEDLPFASFAGQQDTYLNIIGVDAVIEKIQNCWASLFTERAITYRLQNNIDHRKVQIAVVVQEMVFPTTSGILFTADPVTNNHQVMTINAGFGLGEALVSGLVNPDLIHVDKMTGKIISQKIEQKKIKITAEKSGGVQTIDLTEEIQQLACLSEAEIKNLFELGNQVENYFQHPQDIEWAIADGKLYLLQSRPITSLFPIPTPQPADNNLHIYFSFGHVQMMTEPISPMGLSMLSIFLPFGRPPTLPEITPHLKQSAGRIYVDLSPLVNTHPGKLFFPRFLNLAEPVASKQILELVNSEAYQKRNQNRPVKASFKVLTDWIFPLFKRMFAWIFFKNLDNSQQYVVKRNQEYLQKQTELISKSEDTLIKLGKIKKIAASMFYEGLIWMAPVIAGGTLSQVILFRIMKKIGMEQDFNKLQRGLVGNITTEMDLLVGDLADEIRKDPQLKQALIKHQNNGTNWDNFLYQDYPSFYKVWREYLNRFGMRGPGEIDIGRPRWSDNPKSLIQTFLANSNHTVIGAHRIHFEILKQENLNTQIQVLQKLKNSIIGIPFIPLTKRCFGLLNSLAPLREHPKYMIILFLNSLRKELLQISNELVSKNQIDEIQDIWYLTFDEIYKFYQNGGINLKYQIAQQKTLYTHYEKLKPPRVITSDGEIPHTNLQRSGLPDNVFCGSPVSAGKIEGYARVITNPEVEQLQPGEILVAPFTDPGWTPLFINAAGVVLETGGLMTHGSVVAREYGLPAVVGIVDATRIIKTGMKIIVDGDNGIIEVLDEKVNQNP